MILKLYRTVSSDENLKITVNNQSKDITSLDEEVCFDIKEAGTYEVNIEREIAKSNRTPLWILLFILTSPIQGIFNILLHNDNSEWQKDIKPFCLKAKLMVDVQQDTAIEISYSMPNYGDMGHLWRLPKFEFNTFNVVNSSISYVVNHNEFANQYFKYVKRLISVAIAALILFAFLLYLSCINSIVVVSVLLLILIIGIITLATIWPISQYKQLKKIYASFREQYPNDHIDCK